MDIIAGLQNKNNTEAYQLLLLLEKESAESNALYDSFEDLIGLLQSKNSFIRTRGYRLACAQVRWDKEDKLSENLDLLLNILDDEKPAAVRQYLSALYLVVRHKPHLIERIEQKLNSLDTRKYKDSMRPLIEADIKELRTMCGKERQL